RDYGLEGRCRNTRANCARPRIPARGGLVTFVDLVPGSHVFIDANALIYHFSPHRLFGPACRQLLTDVENQTLVGYTSTHIGLSRQFGLLMNDALIVAIMQDHGLIQLASHDADFDRVPGITRYAPA